MLVVYHEALLDRYLLVLGPGDAPDATLADHLDRACRSNIPVWVDCRLLDSVSATAAWLIWACHRRLSRRRLQLVLCRVSKRLERRMRRMLPDLNVHLAKTLDEHK